MNDVGGGGELFKWKRGFSPSFRPTTYQSLEESMITDVYDWRGSWKIRHSGDGRAPVTIYNTDGHMITESTRDEIRDRTTQLLEGLGLNEMEVADNLKAAGIKGSRSEAGQCPVANYLRREIGLPEIFRDVSVQNDWSWVWGQEVENPKAVAAFIKYFDDECYPELDDGCAGQVY